MTETLIKPISLEALVANTPDLPTLPAAVTAVIHETESSTASASSVARYLEQDPALAARVLRLANSAFYSLRRQIMEIPEAVVVLGMRTVRNLAMIAGSYPWMVRELKGYELGPTELWAQSLAVAAGAQAVARRARLNDAEAFSAGLFHNIGKVALSVWLEKKAGLLFSSADDRRPFDEVEREVLGYDHTQVGAHMAESWNLPKPLIRAIRYHHTPSEAPEDGLVACVHVADYLAMTAGLNRGADGLRYNVDAAAFELAGVTAENMAAVMEDFLREYARHDSLFQEKEAA